MEYTDKQKEDIKKLKKYAGKTGLLIGAKAGLKLGAMCVVVALVNQRFVNNDAFLMLMGFVSGFIVFRKMREESVAANAEIAKKVQEIFEIK